MPLFTTKSRAPPRPKRLRCPPPSAAPRAPASRRGCRAHAALQARLAASTFARTSNTAPSGGCGGVGLTRITTPARARPLAPGVGRVGRPSPRAPGRGSRRQRLLAARRRGGGPRLLDEREDKRARPIGWSSTARSSVELGGVGGGGAEGRGGSRVRGCTREVRFTWLVCRWSAGGRQLVKLQGGPPRRMGWVNSMVRTVQAAKREARRASPRRRRSTRSNEEQHKQHDVADAIPVHTECSAATPRAEACSGRAFAHVTSEKASTNPSDIGRDRTSIGKSGRRANFLSEVGWSIIEVANQRLVSTVFVMIRRETPKNVLSGD